jgi:predicted secreted hydrolase
MKRRMLLYGIMAVMLAAGLKWYFAGRVPRPLRASLVAAAAYGSDTAGFARATSPRPFSFPADYGPHDDYQTEWWYYTGNLKATTGEHFGYQLTFFRRALVAPSERVARTSAWGTDQAYMAHFALTDVTGGKHYSYEKLARGAAGLAGAQAAPYRVWLDDWSVSTPDPPSLSTSPDEGAPVSLHASEDGISLTLTLRDLTGPVLQGNQGYSRKGPEPGNASYYYSLPRITTTGTVTVGGRIYEVDGLSWMDHEFSTSALAPGQVGWDWLSLQLDDGSEVMVYQLRRADGRADDFSSGTLIAPDGTTRTLKPSDFVLKATGQWRSPRTGATYPSGWELTVPSAGLRLTIVPYLADQEMATSFPYWEGAVKVTGVSQGSEVVGDGYVELTGYAGSMQGQF